MVQRKKRVPIVAALCATCTGICLLLYGFGFVPLELAELWSKSFLTAHCRQLGRDSRLAFIGIDQPSYGEVLSPEEAASSPILSRMATNSFPWSREVWAVL